MHDTIHPQRLFTDRVPSEDEVRIRKNLLRVILMLIFQLLNVLLNHMKIHDK